MNEFLPIDLHFVVCVGSAFDHHASELDHDVLCSEAAWQSQLEDARVGIAEPVVLNHVFTNDVRRQNRSAAAGRTGVAKRPLGNEWQFSGLGAERLHPKAASDFDRVENDVEFRLHLAINQIEQHWVGVNRGRANRE